MNKKILMLPVAACLTAAIMVGCEQSENVGENLEITTSWAKSNVATRVLKSDFAIGDEIGVYVTSGTLDAMYNNKAEYANVQSIWGGVTWAQSTNVYLDNKEATIYAYYPYTTSAGNGKAIPVESTSQTDYLYGVGDRPANIANSTCNIELKHALTQIAFKIKTKNYSGNGVLQELKVSNNSGANTIYTKGTMNCQTGEITGTELGTLVLAANHHLTETESVFSAMTLPVKDPTADKAIMLTFKIDDVDYTYALSSGTIWAPGTKNVYSITLEGKDVTIGGGDGTGPGADGVTIKEWNETILGEIKLTPIA